MGDTGSGNSSDPADSRAGEGARGQRRRLRSGDGFRGEFYSPERGYLIPNPLEAQFPYWSLPDEILNGRDCNLSPLR